MEYLYNKYYAKVKPIEDFFNMIDENDKQICKQLYNSLLEKFPGRTCRRFEANKQTLSDCMQILPYLHTLNNLTLIITFNKLKEFSSKIFSKLTNLKYFRITLTDNQNGGMGKFKLPFRSNRIVPINEETEDEIEKIKQDKLEEEKNKSDVNLPPVLSPTVKPPPFNPFSDSDLSPPLSISAHTIPTQKLMPPLQRLSKNRDLDFYLDTQQDTQQEQTPKIEQQEQQIPKLQRTTRNRHIDFFNVEDLIIIFKQLPHSLERLEIDNLKLKFDEFITRLGVENSQSTILPQIKNITFNNSNFTEGQVKDIKNILGIRN